MFKEGEEGGCCTMPCPTCFKQIYANHELDMNILIIFLWAMMMILLLYYRLITIPFGYMRNNKIKFFSVLFYDRVLLHQYLHIIPCKYSLLLPIFNIDNFLYVYYEE
jgi:hypothetical protein